MTLPKQTIIDETGLFHTNVSTYASGDPKDCCRHLNTSSDNERMLTSTQASSNSQKIDCKSAFTFAESNQTPPQTNLKEEQKEAFLRKQYSFSIQSVPDGHKTWRTTVPETIKREEFDAEYTSVADLRGMNEEDIDTDFRLQTMSGLSDFPDKDGDTLLHVALLLNLPATHLAELIPLLALQGQVNHLNHLHQTPLHLAVLTHHPQALSLLLALGASLTIQDTHGNTPLHLACLRNDLRAVKILCHQLEGEDLEAEKMEEEGDGTGWKGGRSKRKEEVKSALEGKNCEGFTCLHLAVQNRNADLVDFLLQIGADVNAQEGKGGRTALHLTVDTPTPSVNILTLLLLHPHLHLNATNFAQQTALQLARGRGHLHLVDLLHAHGADWSDSCHSHYSYESDDDDDDFVMMYDDLCIAGQPVLRT